MHTIEDINVEIDDGGLDWRVLEDYVSLTEGGDTAARVLPKLARRIIKNWDSVLDQLEALHGRADIPTCTRIIVQAFNVAAGASSEAEAKN